MTDSPGIKRCCHGHALTKKNTYTRTCRGKTSERCVTCRRMTTLKYRRKKGEAMGTKPKRAQVNRELLRTKVYTMPDSPYRTAMLEAYAAFDKWEAMDKRPQRYGRPKAA